jgi:ethanolamine ammonia-lyase small subunit
MEIDNRKHLGHEDQWASLKQYTSARIALGRVGVSVPLRDILNFKLAHAHARDAIFAALDVPALHAELETIGMESLQLRSKAVTREVYLQRPDLGRQLDDDSSLSLKAVRSESSYDVAFIVADGLSASAVNAHAGKVLQMVVTELRTQNFTLAPVVLVSQGRVAISDEIGSLINARMAVILIGERPGLSSPDSMGAYLTYNPFPGLTDDARNCVSNIRPEGLDYISASSKLIWLITESLRRKISGVSLKEEHELRLE